MKKRYGSLMLAGLLWALSSTSTVQGDLVQDDLVQDDLVQDNLVQDNLAQDNSLDRVKVELKPGGTLCRMGLEFEPNG